MSRGSYRTTMKYMKCRLSNHRPQRNTVIAERLSTSLVIPTSIEAFTASCLISLNKNPGIKPFGVGEVWGVF